MSGTLFLPEKAVKKEETISEQEHMSFSLEAHFRQIEPRLRRFVLSRGIGPGAVDDVIQETLLEAWRHLERLRSAELFAAWLTGICRNVCLRWSRTQYADVQHLTSFSGFSSSDEPIFDYHEPESYDLTEELEHQDLVVLVDRALSHLPIETRKAIEMHYLAELPQREVASRLGLSLNALDVKLHRGRKQLRQILSTKLRVDAQAFGLTVDEMVEDAWQPTSIWCILCGHRRMVGKFRTLPDGNIDMCLRCPDCCQQDDQFISQTSGIIDLRSARSFRPAWKKTLQHIPLFFADLLTTGEGRCPTCHQMLQHMNKRFISLPSPCYRRYCLELLCQYCGAVGITSIVINYLLPHAAQPFILSHSRYIIEPEQLISFQGQDAISVSLRDIDSNARFIVFAHPETLQILGTS